MRIGHRRTQSDNFYCIHQKSNIKLRLRPNQSTNQIAGLINYSNRKNKTKTVCIQSIETPLVRSQQNLMFYFGKRGYESPSCISTQLEDQLKSIPQKKLTSNISIRKSLKCQKQGFLSSVTSKMISPQSKNRKSQPHLKTNLIKSNLSKNSQIKINTKNEKGPTKSKKTNKVDKQRRSLKQKKKV